MSSHHRHSDLQERVDQRCVINTRPVRVSAVYFLVRFMPTRSQISSVGVRGQSFQNLAAPQKTIPTYGTTIVFGLTTYLVIYKVLDHAATWWGQLRVSTCMPLLSALKLVVDGVGLRPKGSSLTQTTGQAHTCRESFGFLEC